jgi:class 3 adenylate cyclase/predicted ATPase
MDYDAILAQVLELLQRDKRVSYRVLKRRLDLHDDDLEDLKEDLIYAKKLALDEAGRVLVWAGDAGETPEPGQPSQPSPLPVIQADQSASAPAALSTPDAERRQLTVMFCDLVGSTPLSEQLDPEDLREVVRAYQQTCAEVVQRFDGHIAQLLGDALLVYFGWPQAHEDDAQRAVRTGLGMLEAMGTLNARLEQENSVRLAIRVGIHTGLVVVGEMGSGGHQEQLALGEVPNIASRLQGLAAPDTVAISEATSRLIAGYFTCQDLGAQRLKGVAEPMRVYRVLGNSGVQSRLDIATTTGLTPLVGRESEVTLLLERWAQVKEGQGHVVLLSGEGGIGKSRLVQVLKEHVVHVPHFRWECRCSPYYANSALYPVIDLFRRAFALQRDDAPADKLRKMEQTLTPYASLPDMMPLFASLLSVPLDDHYPPLTLTPERQKQQTLEAVLTLLLAMAAQQPVLFILEDLHWVDPSTLELLDLLIDQAPTASILTLLTCRPAFQPPWSHRSYLTEVTVRGLSRSQITQMVEKMLGGKRLPAEVLHQIVKKTDGVPLFVEEMTKAMLESGHLKAGDGRYELTESLPSLAIPATLQDSLMARLDRLGSAKAMAQYAAVIGRQFSYALLQAVAQVDEATLQRELRRLVEAELVYQRGLPPQATYTFKHALIQDAAYASLLKSTRQQYHQRIAQVIRERFPETAEAQPELLAYHYTEAGHNEQAITYWQQAGRRAIGQSSTVEGIAHLRTGLALLDTLPETVQRAQQELLLYTTLGPALMTVKGYAAPEVKQAYTRARELCRQAGDTPRRLSVLLGLGTYYCVSAELQTAREIGAESLRLALQSNDPGHCLQAYLLLGTATLYLGELTSAHEYLTQGIRLDTTRPDPSRVPSGATSPRVSCRTHASHALWQLGYPAQAQQRSDEGLRLAQELAHPISITAALIWSAATYHHLREVQVVQQRIDMALTLAAKERFAYFTVTGTAFRGLALAMQGRYDEGIAQLRQGVDTLQSTGATVALSFFLAGLAEAYGQNGQPEDGLRTLATALAHVEQTGERWFEAEICRLKGVLLLKRAVPDTVEAEACFQQALDIARRQQAKSWELRAATSLAFLWQSQDKRQEAYDLLAPVYHWFTEGFDTADLQEAQALLEALSSPER